MKIKILGSGTSSGVPVIACSCPVCSSTDLKNKRLRASIYIDLQNDNSNNQHILIDIGPDFRTQALANKIENVDAVFYTHSHADHIFGTDDIRIFNFKHKKKIPVYANSSTSADLNRIFGYCFIKDPNYLGGGVPNLKLTTLTPNDPFFLEDEKIIPLKIYHGNLEILGFRIRNFAYLTDCNHVPAETLKLIDGIDTLIVSGLRERPHETHFNFKQAVEFGNQTSAKNIYLTHLSHDVDHHKAEGLLAEMNNNQTKTFKLCYDGQELELA